MLCYLIQIFKEHLLWAKLCSRYWDMAGRKAGRERAREGRREREGKEKETIPDLTEFTFWNLLPSSGPYVTYSRKSSLYIESPSAHLFIFLRSLSTICTHS